MKLASGAAPVMKYLAAGVNVGLGTDYTIYALIDGVVKFEHKSRSRYKVSVYPAPAGEAEATSAA